MVRRPLLVLALVVACGDPASGPQGQDVGAWEVWSWADPGGGDAGESGGAADAGAVTDAGAVADSAGADAGGLDVAGEPDGGPGGGPDTQGAPGTPDTAAPDTAEPPPLTDGDVDGVPDIADLFPADPSLPGTAYGGVVYAHTADELWRMDVKTYQLDFVAFFGWPADGNLHEMTDIAIDRYGVLYGVSHDALYTCHPQKGGCLRVGTLPSGYNALTFVPAGLLDADRDVLVAIGGGNQWTRLDRSGDSFVPTILGTYGALYTSSGDAYSIKGVGTYATVNKTGDASDWLVAIHPATGHVTAEIGRLDGFSTMYGLAGWTDRAFGFDESGAVVVVDTTTGKVVNVIQNTPKKWWGAGVRTYIQ